MLRRGKSYQRQPEFGSVGSRNDICQTPFSRFPCGVFLFLEEWRNRWADIPILVHSDGLYGHLGREDFA